MVLILLGVIVFGVGGSTLYLMVFNRRTRQGLHDLAVGSYVIRAGDTGPVETKPMWKVHWAILGLLLLTLTAALAFFNHKMEKWGRFPQSGYLLDATRPNGLWFGQFCKWNRLNLNGLLYQSIEQFAP